MRTFAILMLGVLFISTTASAQATRPSGPVAMVELSGEINDYTADVFEKHVAAARASGAKTILVRIDTPGGGVESALRMSQFIKRQRPAVQMVAVVHEMALSAGSMLAVACDRIVMEPGALLGDCAPIVMGSNGLQTLGAAERAKFESPILAEFYDSADRSGYDRTLVTAMVQYGAVVHYVESPDHERRFVGEADYADLRKAGWADVAGVPNPLDGPQQLLTVNDTLAKKIGLSVGTFASPADYAAANGLSIDRVFETTFGETAVGFLSGPVVRGLLGVVFMASIYTAFSKPGTGVPEVVALVTGAVLFGVPLLTGYAGILEILMIVAGVLMLALELFVIPGFGVAGITGVVLILLGFVLTFAPPELPGGGVVPQLPATRDAIRNGLIAVTLGLIGSAGLWVWLSRQLPNLPYMNRLVLKTSVGDAAAPADVRDAVDAAWPLVGDTGRAISDLRPGGVARFFDPLINDDRNVDVVSDHGFVGPGAFLVVKAKEGTRVVVRAVEA